MPLNIPTLRERRIQVRDLMRSALDLSVPLLPKSPERALSDGTAAVGNSLDVYAQKIARQIFATTATGEFLDELAQTWLADGRRPATFATGTVAFTGIAGTSIPAGTRLSIAAGVDFETISDLVVGSGGVAGLARAIDPGLLGNAPAGAVMNIVSAISGVDGTATAATAFEGGVNQERDADLRARILRRIQAPPHGGAEHDYPVWAGSYPGVTRSWAYPEEMGLGTVTVRFMMDVIRADADGFPTASDAEAVRAHVDARRPVTARDIYVVAPTPYPLQIPIARLSPDTLAVRGAVEAELRKMFQARSQPGQTIYRSWVAEAISRATGEMWHDLAYEDTPMPTRNDMPTFGGVEWL